MMLQLIANFIYRIFCVINVQKKIGIFKLGSSEKYINVDLITKKLPKDKIISLGTGKNPIKNLWGMARCNVIALDQTNWYISNITISKKTKIVQCWHSSGLLKKIGFDAKRKGCDVNSEYKRIKRIHGQVSYFIISDERLKSIYANAFELKESQILPLGLARTDELNKVKKIPKIKKILLYAPTFRVANGERIHKYELDIYELKRELGKEWEFLIKRHPTVQMDIPNGWIDVSDHEMNKLLGNTDLLVSDFSSIIFDFSFFCRPIVLMNTSSYEYIKNDRDLYVTQEDLVGKNNVCNSTNELIIKIKNKILKNSDLWKRYMSACDGKSSERIANFLLRINETK